MFLIRIGRQRWTTIAENADALHCYQEMRPDCVYSWIELFTRSVTFVPSFSCREEYFIFGVNAMVILKFLSPEAGLYYWNGPFLSVWYVAQRQKSVAYICALYTHVKAPLVLQKVVLLWAFYISNISITFFFVICKVFGDDYYSFRRNRKFTDCLLHEIVFLWLSGVVHAIVCLLIFDLWSSQY